MLAFHPVGLRPWRGGRPPIEVVPQVGDFIAKADPLFRVHGGTTSESATVTIRRDRSRAHDGAGPRFAFRIIVDIADKALSPVINDPTTAVLAIDQLHPSCGPPDRDLDMGQVRDATGRLRLVDGTPNWDDLVALAATEIRHYGNGSIQVARRLLAMLESLIPACSKGGPSGCERSSTSSTGWSNGTSRTRRIASVPSAPIRSGSGAPSPDRPLSRRTVVPFGERGARLLSGRWNVKMRMVVLVVFFSLSSAPDVQQAGARPPRPCRS